MFEKLKKIKQRHQDISEMLSDPEIFKDQNKFRKLAKEHSDLAEIVEKYDKYERILIQISEANEIIEHENDKELVDLAEAELEELQEQHEKIEQDLKLLLIPKDPEDEKNAIVEIRAGTGGNEACLFAGDLYKMYLKYAEQQSWRIEILNSHPQEIGGFKEISFLVNGPNAYGKLKFEAGVHRVQRVPITEASGRLHTSAASVAVLPEVEEVDVNIAPNDLRIDVFRSSGPGGQSVNTTDSAVRITHIPTGMVVTCQDEKSQHKNKAKALKVLRARLYEKRKEEEEAKLTASRRSMVSTGDRSAKIRTFNFPQNRVTDHRINLTLYKLDKIIEGDLDGLIDQLQIADRAEKLNMSETD
ncbi:MAG: peptide chain release factor 1 [bacterium]|nr:MAG: peptide chain release factor 1 [bacterium]